eukprot:6204173-Pleurochrysis_carterae.AAC.3
MVYPETILLPDHFANLIGVCISGKPKPHNANTANVAPSDVTATAARQLLESSLLFGAGVVHHPTHRAARHSAALAKRRRLLEAP